MSRMSDFSPMETVVQSLLHFLHQTYEKLAAYNKARQSLSKRVGELLGFWPPWSNLVSPLKQQTRTGT